MKTITFQGEEYTLVSENGGRNNLITILTFVRTKSFGVSILTVQHLNYSLGPEFEVAIISLTGTDLRKITHIMENGLVAATTKTESKEINDTYIVPQEEQNHEHAPL